MQREMGENVCIMIFYGLDLELQKDLGISHY
jgi:hypothetical protein